MNKYNFDLDMESDNSNSTILRNIKPNSKVLEVGCAYGRMTRYLKENLNCDVHIIENDYEAIQCASNWANKALYLNLNDQDRDSIDVDKDYDYVIFADVLEHLIDPKSVLIYFKQFLKEDGSIWISIPNIGHNSVLIDLWNNKFTYRETGLLDNTHVRFFTEESLTIMVYKCGLKPVNQINLINTVENTEFKNNYIDVPEQVAELMKKRYNGEVYQFVWELKK